jgi:hypothetical protein
VKKKEKNNTKEAKCYNQQGWERKWKHTRKKGRQDPKIRIEGGVHMLFSHLFVTTNTKRIAHNFLKVLLKFKDSKSKNISYHF